jgi:hypothetical protein
MDLADRHKYVEPPATYPIDRTTDAVFPDEPTDPGQTPIRRPSDPTHSDSVRLVMGPSQLSDIAGELRD